MTIIERPGIVSRRLAIMKSHMTFIMGHVTITRSHVTIMSFIFMVGRMTGTDMDSMTMWDVPVLFTRTLAVISLSHVEADMCRRRSRRYFPVR